jgi:hypothetical protein
MFRRFILQMLVCGLLVTPSVAAAQLMTVQNIGHALVHDPAGDSVDTNGISIRFSRPVKLTITGHFSMNSRADASLVERVVIYQFQSPGEGANCQQRSCWLLLKQTSNFESADFSYELDIAPRQDLMVVRYAPVVNAKRGGDPASLHVIDNNGADVAVDTPIHVDTLRIRGDDHVTLEIAHG